MALINKRGLRQLVRVLLAGGKIEDLTLLIKSGAGKEAYRVVGSLPESFEKRKSIPDGEYIVNSPEKRIVNPVSRSPSDYWTVIYKNKIVVQGQFLEVHQALQETFREVISWPQTLIRQFLFYGGIVGILALFFFSGFELSRYLLEKNKPQQDFSKLGEFLDNIKTQQETTNSALGAVSAQLKEAVSAQRKEAKIAATKIAEESRKEIRKFSFAEKLLQDTENQDSRQLMDLENKKRDLLLKDEELDRKGFTVLHPSRSDIKGSIEALDRQIGQIKKKYNIASE